MKNTLSRRIISFLMSVVLTFSCMDLSSISAMAYEDNTSADIQTSFEEETSGDVSHDDIEIEEDDSEENLFEGSEEIEGAISEEISGHLEGEGYDIIWTISQDGIITISGSGAMPDESKVENYPWYSYKSDITGIVIGKDITHVGNYAFRDYNGSKLTSLVFESGSKLVSIGDYAFRNLDYIHEINLPDGIKTVGNFAFDDCERITSLNLATVEEIGEEAFQYISYDNTYKLTSITIPNTVKTIGKNAFSENRHVTSVIFEDSSSLTTLGERAFYGCTSLTDITVPKSVTSMAKSVFANCSSLTEVTLEEGISISEIPESAFENDKRVTSVTIPNSITEIKSYAFSGCESLEAVTIPENVTKIGSYAFNNCKKITSISIPKNVSSIDSYAFQDCILLENVDFEEGVGITTFTSCMFRRCESLESVIVPSTVTKFDGNCFEGCKALSSISGTENITAIGSSCFKGCSSLTSFVWPSAIKEIPSGCFEAAGLTSFTIPSTVTSISSYAFKSTPITAVDIPSAVTSLGSGVFEYCEKLKTVSFAEDFNKVSTISSYMFDGCTMLESIALPSCINRIDSYAFRNCSALKTIVVSDGQITNLGSNAFEGCTLLETFILPSTATTVSGGAYKNCTAIKNVVLPAGITSIGSNAFEGCTNLESVSFTPKEDGTYAIKEIGGSAFKNCSSLKSFTFPASITQTYLASNMFEGCAALEEVTVNTNSFTEISSSAFKNCSSLTGIIIPDSVKKIGSDCFNGCTSLTEITFPNNENYKEISDRCFQDCTALSDISIPGTITKICGGAFKNCSLITSVNLPDSLTQIDSNAFENTGLTSVVFPKNITSLGSAVFLGCGNLESVSFADGFAMTSLSYELFKNCTSLTSIVLPASLTSFNSNTYTGCSALKAIYVDENSAKFKSLCGIVVNKNSDGGYGSFVYRPLAFGTDEEAIVLPNDLTRIYSNYFGSCTSIKKLVIPASVTTIEDSSFSGCTNLEEVVFEKDAQGKYTVTSLANSIFKNCSTLKTFIIPDTVTTIYSQAFYGCSSLETINIPASVSQIYGNSFDGCSSLKAINVASDNETYYSTFGIVFKKSDNSKYITPAGLEKPFVIPETLETLTKTIIDLWADNQTDGKNKSNITEFTVGKNVKNIDSNAFGSLSNLQNIYVDEENSTFISWSGALVKTADWTLVYKPSKNAGDYSVFPEGITIINKGFFNNTGLTSIELPASVKTIGSQAYAYCTGLKTVTIPKNVTSVAVDAFLGCSSLKSILVEEGNKVYYSKNGCLYLKATNERVIRPDAAEVTPPEDGDEEFSAYYKGNTTIKSIVIPASITVIKAEAFKGCTSLAKVTFASGSKLKYIESSAFEGCTALTSISLPASVESIGNRAFYGTKLSSVTIPESVKVIGGSAYANCSKLEKLTVKAKVTSIPGNMLTGCLVLKTVVLPTTITSIENNTFNGLSKLTSVNLSSLNKLTRIGNYAFAGTKLQKYAIPASVTTIGDYAFSDCNSVKTFTVPNTVTSIGSYVFTDCAILQSVTIPAINTGSYIFENCAKLSSVKYSGEAKITRISAGTFYKCTSLKSLAVPATVTEIGGNAFYGCSSLAEISLNTNVTTIAMGAFSNCTKLAQVTIKDCGKDEINTYPLTIASSAFANCTALVEIKIPLRTNNINSNAFTGCTKLARFVMDAIPEGVETTYIVSDGIIYSNGGKNFYLMPPAWEMNGDVLSIPEGTETISDYSFKSNNDIISVEFPSTIKSIGSYAFSGCECLKKVTFKAGSETGLSLIENIGDGAFTGCIDLSSVVFEGDTPELSSISAYTFQNCGDLAYVEFRGTSSISTIGASAFANCYKLKSIQFTNNSCDIELKTKAFYNDKKFTGLYNADELASLGNIAKYALRRCESVKELRLGKSFSFVSLTVSTSEDDESTSNSIYPTATSMDELASLSSITVDEENAYGIYSVDGVVFSEDKELIWFPQAKSGVYSVPAGTVKIGDRAMAGAKGVKRIVIPESVTAFGDYSFACMTGVKEIVYEGTSQLYSIGKYAMTGMTSLEVLTIPESVRTIAFYAFADCETIKEGIIPDTVTSIGTSLFYSCGALKTGYLPAAIDAIPEMTFFNCYNMTTFEVPQNITRIGKEAFYNTNISTFVVPSKVTTIDESAFYNCDNLIIDLSQAASLKTIDSEAFYGNTSLTEIVIPEGVTSMGAFVFQSCSILEKVTLPSTLTSLNNSWYFTSGTMAYISGNYMFYNCNNLQKVVVMNDTMPFGKYMFYSAGSYSPQITIYANEGSTAESYVTEKKYETNYIKKTLVFETLDKVDEEIKDPENQDVSVSGFTDSEESISWNFDGSTLSFSYTGVGNSDLYYDGEYLDYLYEEEKETWVDYIYNAKNVIFGEGITSIALSRELRGNSSVLSINIAASVETIEDYCFANMNALQELIFADNSQMKEIPEGFLYFSNSVKTVVLPENIKKIGELAFCYSMVEEIKIPASVEIIDYAAFEHTPKLESVTFEEGSKLKKIDGDAFYCSISLKTIEFPEGLEEIGNMAFAMSGLEGNIVLPASVKDVSSQAFYRVGQITGYSMSADNDIFRAEGGIVYKYEEGSITAWLVPDTSEGEYYIPSFVNSLPASDTINAKSFRVAENNEYFAVIDECLYSKDGKILYRVPNKEYDTIAVIDGCEELADYAICEASVKNVILPDSVKKLGKYCFDFSDVVTINIPQKVAVIPDYCFNYCKDLEKVEMNNTVTEIGKNAFTYCESLEEIELPDSLVYIGNFAFYEAKSLKTIKIPSRVEVISEGAFEYAGALTEVILSDGLLEISNSAFYGCDSLKSIFIPDTVKTIGSRAFDDCDKLAEVYIGKNVRTIKSYAFGYCKSLREISFPDGLEKLEEDILCFCTALEKVYIPASVKDIYYSVYNGTSSTYYYGPFYACNANTVFYGESGSYAEAFMSRDDVKRYASGGKNIAYKFVALNNTKYSIEYVLDATKGEKNNLNNPSGYRAGDSAITLYPATKAGYVFEGWYTDLTYSTKVDIISPVEAKDFVLYPKWAEALTVTIMEYDDIERTEGEYFTVSVPQGKCLKDVLPGLPERNGLIFEGFCDESGNTFDILAKIDESLTLTALWKTAEQLIVFAPRASEQSGKINHDDRIFLESDTSDAIIIYSFTGAPSYEINGSEITASENSFIYSEPLDGFAEGSEINLFAIAIKEDLSGNYIESTVSKYIYEVIDESCMWGDVNKEDRLLYKDPSEIPDGIWIAGVPEKTTYTGKAITFAVRVYDNKTLLTADNDYKITYKNNTVAASADAKKAPYVSVSGKGNYKGEKIQKFTIEKADIAESDITFTGKYYAYTGKAQKVAPTVTYNGIKLKNGKDYSLEYPGRADTLAENYEGSPINDYKNEGIWAVKIVGKGNFEGYTLDYYFIKDAIPLNKVTLNNFRKSITYDTEGEYYTNTGFEQTKLVLTYKKNKTDQPITLIEYVDYTVSYIKNAAVGTATMVISPTSDGRLTGVLTKTFKITGVSIKKAKLEGFEKSFVYNGKDQRQNNVVVKLGNTVLVNSRDYVVSYSKNLKLGKVTVTYTGIGKYTGSVKKVYTISAYDLKKDASQKKPFITAEIVANDNGAVSYEKGGAKPKVVVRYRGAELSEGKDYKLSYKNNTTTASKTSLKAPVVTITGKGSFKGNISLKFDIVPSELSGLTILAKDVTYKNAAGNYVTTITVVDKNGKSLTAGSDYGKNLTYTFAEPTRLSDGTVKNSGDVVQPTDSVSAGTRIKVTANGLGSTYAGSISAVYSVVVNDISKGKAQLTSGTVYSYNGKVIIPSKNSLIITVNNTALTADDYEIVSCVNNIKKGTATLTIRGKNGYGGVLVVKFAINEKNF